MSVINFVLFSSSMSSEKPYIFLLKEMSENHFGITQSGPSNQGSDYMQTLSERWGKGLVLMLKAAEKSDVLNTDV